METPLENKERLADNQNNDEDSKIEAYLDEPELLGSEMAVATEQEMTFEFIMEGATCPCTDNCISDPSLTFMKKIDGPTTRDKDFITYWEKGKPPASNSCEDLCGIRGLSIHTANSQSEIDLTIEVYKKTLTIKPNGKTKYILFSIKKGSGVHKLTPTTDSDNHCDFYKSDNFTVAGLTIASTNSI